MANPLYDALFGRQAGLDHCFLIREDGTEISYSGFLQRASLLANVLTLSGVLPGDRVAVQVRKSADALALYAACVRSGAVYLPLNTAYTENEVSYFLEDSEAKLFVCDPARAEALAPVAAKCAARLETLDDAEGGTLADAAIAASDQFETVHRASDDLAAILYTSGTTGRSKGAMLTHANLLSNAKVLAEAWRFTSDDVLLHALPIFHTHGLFVATHVVLASGASMILLPKFDIDALLAWLPKATTMMGVPTFYTRLLEAPGFDRALVTHMRLFTSGSAPLQAETHRQFHTVTGHMILERYGMTETNMNTSNPYDGERRAGTVGPALPGVEVRITDPASGDPISDGEINSIEIKGPNVFSGYWRMPEKTKQEFRDDGFFVTGDLGSKGGDGYVTIVGRSKDLIISGGYNIYPKEIEALLDDQSGIRESAVVGIQHPDFGEVPIAILVAEPGCEPDIQHLESVLHASLARFKHPRRMFVVAELPRNAMGKVLKADLRQSYSGLFERA